MKKLKIIFKKLLEVFYILSINFIKILIKIIIIIKIKKISKFYIYLLYLKL